MAKRSDTFELWLIGAALVLVFAFKAIFDIFFEEWFKRKFQELFGRTVAEMIERFGGLFLPVLFAIAVVWILNRYVRREYSQQRVVCRFLMNDAGCVRRNTTLEFDRVAPSGIRLRHRARADYYRIKVETAFVSVPDTSAHLVSIRRDGQIIFDGESVPLPFVVWEQDFRHESTRRQIRNGLPEYVDLLAIVDSGEIIITTRDYIWPNSIPLPNGMIVAGNGVYEFEVMVSAPASAATKVVLELTWSGDRATAQMRQLRAA